MKKMEMAKLAMQKTVLNLLDENSGIWSSLDPVSAKVAQLRSLTEAAEADRKTQLDLASNGFTSQKNQACDEMLELAYKIAQKLKDWAESRHNELVRNAVDYSHTRLTSGTFGDQLARCQLILNKAEDNISSLSTYHITAESLAPFRQLVDSAGKLSVTRDTAGSTRRSATNGIGTKIGKAGVVLRKLDGLIESFTDDRDTDFVNAYFEARKSIYHRGRAEKLPAAKKEEHEV